MAAATYCSWPHVPPLDRGLSREWPAPIAVRGHVRVMGRGSRNSSIRSPGIALGRTEASEELVDEHGVAVRIDQGDRACAGAPRLRHLAGTLAAATGASTKELMHRLGHASPRAALRYQHATAERDEAIADGIDRILEASGNNDDQDTNVIRFRRAAE